MDRVAACSKPMLASLANRVWTSTEFDISTILVHVQREVVKWFTNILITCYEKHFNGSNPDGSFTMDESNMFLSSQGFPPNTIYR